MDKDKLGIDNEGNFLRWKKILELEDRAVQIATDTTRAELPGIDFGKVLQKHNGKMIKITIEVLNES